MEQQRPWPYWCECEYCGGKWNTPFQKAKYCSPRCRTRGNYWNNRDAKLAYQKQYTKEHPEVAIRSRAKYNNKPESKLLASHHKNQARARMAGAEGSHSVEQWLELVEKYGGRCVICNIAQRRVDRDHIVPLSKGGTDYISNIQPLCKSCNGKEAAKVD